MMKPTLHPYCGKCGWRKGGLDSWDGRACKCGDSAPAYFQSCDGCPTPVECAVVQRCLLPLEPLDPLGGPLTPDKLNEDDKAKRA